VWGCCTRPSTTQYPYLIIVAVVLLGLQTGESLPTNVTSSTALHLLQ
jgi:hypothetical protein